MEKSKKTHILILACGGSGMNVLAQHLVSSGINVLGSDRSFDQNKKQREKRYLEQIGVTIINEDRDLSKFNLKKIYLSPAIEDSHPALIHAKNNKIETCYRSEYLLELYNKYFSVGICGTSGKTTVTGMVATILSDQNKDFDVFCGAEINNFSDNEKLGNYLQGKSNSIVLEVDESEGTINKYISDIACITTISEDHYSIEKLQKMFEEFAANSKEIVLNIDNQHIAELYKQYKKISKTVSLVNEDADYYIKLEKEEINRIEYSIKGIKGEINISGRYNLLNAGCAIAISNMLGISIENTLKSLAHFQGVKNRFECLTAKNSHYILDFAHNPEKILFSLQSAQNYQNPVIYVFQPHGYGPFRSMFHELIKVIQKQIKKDDCFCFLDIYDAGGTADRSISSEDIIKPVNRSNVLYFNSRKKLKEFLDTKALANITCVISGARDNSLRHLRDMLYEEKKTVK